MKKIVFLGDSITECFKKISERENVINMGISGNRTIDVIARLENVKNANPDILFLMIGINDFMTNKHIWFTDFPIDINRTYEYILNYLKENLKATKFYILPILPVLNGKIVSIEQVELFNKEIDQLNNDIKILAKKYNMTYLDFNNQFKDENNNLKKEFTTDGIHLNDNGYEIFYKNIFTFFA